jgi:methionyl-tRNA formyltransferase
VRIAYFGTPEFAVGALHELVRAGHELVAVVTPPDRPAGRGREPRTPPVAEAARALGLTVHQVEGVGTPEFRDWLRAREPEIGVVAAFGKIFGPQLLGLPPLGCVNIHASLLPRWRGAGPIQAAILAGDRESGVSLMQMERGLDTGPVWLARAVPIAAEETGASLHDKLAKLGAEVVVEGLRVIARGEARPAPQDEALATRAPRWEKADGRIRWTDDAASLERRVRALYPWPGTSTRHQAKELRLLPPVEAVSGPAGGPSQRPPGPGTVVAAGPLGVEVACGDGGLLRLVRLQLEGRKVLEAGPFLAGHPLPVGTVLGP